MPLRLACLILLTALLIAAGCGDRSRSAVDPAAEPQSTPVAQPEGLLGAFALEIDPTALTASLAPLERGGQAFGDIFTADISGFMSSWPCQDCIQVERVGRAHDGLLFMDFQLRHPFPLPDEFNPTPAARLDLHLFDLRGIFLFKPLATGGNTQTFAQLASMGGSAGGPAALSIDNSGFLASISRDGYTGVFDSYTDTFFPTTATLHPFSLLHEDTGVSNFEAGHPNGVANIRFPQGHNVFRQGGGPYTRRVYFNMSPGDPQVQAVIVLAASYGVSAVGRGSAFGQRMNPVYYVPEFNMKEPWRVRVHEKSSSLEASNPNTSAQLEVEIYDWQHQRGTDTVSQLSPAPGIPRNKLRRPSRVQTVRAQVPGVASPGHVIPTYSGGTGLPGDPLRWTVQIPNALQAGEGSYTGLLEIVDEYQPLDPSITGVRADGSLFAAGRPSTFLPFVVTVAPASGAPILMGGSNGVFPGGTSAYGSLELNYTNLTYNSFVVDRVGSLDLTFLVQSAKGGILTGSDVLFTQSTNKGQSWSAPNITNSSALSQLGDQTQPAMTLGPDHALYLVYTHKGTGLAGSDILFQRSHDLGSNWSTPTRVHPVNTKINDRPSIGVTPAGRIVVTYNHDNKNKIGISWSDDGGSTWPLTFNYTSERKVAGPEVLPMPASVASNGFVVLYNHDQHSPMPDIQTLWYPNGTSTLSTRIAVSAESSGTVPYDDRGAFRKADGTLYITWLEKLNSTTQVMVTKKAPAASAFETPKVLTSLNSKVAEHPVVAARGSGEVVVVWNDNRDSVTGHDLYLAYSNNGGTSWLPPYRYFATAHHERWPQLAVHPVTGKLLMGWWNSSLGNGSNSLFMAMELD